MPVLGQGTWHLGEGRHPVDVELAALRLGIELGMTLIDTAEMYGDGESERLVGRAIAGRRPEMFVVSKVLPEHATLDGTVAACEASLRRLGTDYLDLYLLHWRGEIPLGVTVAAFEQLRETGRIRHWGVSNFDVHDMADLFGVASGKLTDTDQVHYNLTRRGIELDLLPWALQSRIPIMAYTPIEQGRLLEHPVVGAVAARHEATPAQVAIAWVLRWEGVCAIPESGSPEHVRENRGAVDVRLTEEDLAELDRAFPPPEAPRPLVVI
jgi:diketogulonate reductase-like aldo/keto reductase